MNYPIKIKLYNANQSISIRLENRPFKYFMNIRLGFLTNPQQKQPTIAVNSFGDDINLFLMHRPDGAGRLAYGIHTIYGLPYGCLAIQNSMHPNSRLIFYYA